VSNIVPLNFKNLKTTRNMKKIKLLSMLFSVALVVSLIAISACTKEGPAGAPGKDGENGINGTDGTATCGVCHDNSETVETKIGQWATSFHATSGLQFENATGCAPCHTSQGFKEVVNTANTATAAAPENPANINCYTCHKIHDTYAASDWELRKTTPMTFWLTGETVDIGKANICIQCHQPRISYTIPDVTQPDADYTITSKRFGPHHGSQGATYTGSGYYKVGTGYENTHTVIADGCVTCHMATASGYYAGGHTFAIFDEESGSINTAGCVTCHSDADALAADIASLQTEVTDKLAQLGVLLQTAGIYNPASTSGTAVPGTYTNKVAGAYWNWTSLTEDKSLGVHNPKFVERILDNSIASLQ
jgi:hypothetical protein